MTAKTTTSTGPRPESPQEAALTRCERSLGAPIVPGEAPGWCRTATRALNDPAIGPSDRLRDLAEILDDDLELARRVEQLTEREARLQAERVRLVAALGGAAADAEPGAEHDAAAPLEQVRELRREAIAWASALRAHTSAVEAWWLEAAYRDRGTKD